MQEKITIQQMIDHLNSERTRIMALRGTDFDQAEQQRLFHLNVNMVLALHDFEFLILVTKNAKSEMCREAYL